MTVQQQQTAEQADQAQATPTAKQTQGNGDPQTQGTGSRSQTQGNGGKSERQSLAPRGERTQESESLPTFIPRADVLESKDGFRVVLDMPGADPQSLDITLEKHVLAVSARSTPWQPEGYQLVMAEYQDGNYARSFVLSDQIDENRIEAGFRDGVLRLNLPKAPPAPAKKIKVSAA